MNDTQTLLNDLQKGSINRREFVSRALALGISLSSISAMVQACGGSGPNGSGSAIKWENWANPGELPRFQQFTANYNKTHHANVKYSFVPSADNNYFSKILTQLNGGVAPDVFYVGDGDISKLIQNQTIAELTPLLTSSASKAKPDDYVEGLWGAAKTRSGKIYAIPPDCNPLVLWYNKQVLQEAGITTMPADIYEKGQWTREAFQEMLDKIHAKGKYGYILDDGSVHFWSWCTVNGGKVYDDNGYGNFIAHEDAKSLDAIKWLAGNVRSKKITFAANLPKGQGEDLAFIGNQVGFILLGRWDLPEFRASSDLQYDCVPLPSATGKIAPAVIALAYTVINKRTKDLNGAFDFVTSFTDVEGQTFRLQGGGNAVPSIKGAEQVVTTPNIPEHAHYLLDARNVGYALFPAEMGTPGLTTDIQTTLDPMWLQGGDVTSALASIAAMANPRIKDAQSKMQ